MADLTCWVGYEGIFPKATLIDLDMCEQFMKV